jgi:hypothetical protein
MKKSIAAIATAAMKRTANLYALNMKSLCHRRRIAIFSGPGINPPAYTKKAPQTEFF